ncbi:37S ribosomal protein, mitochondrial [Physocladia obscura]|uniref:37S ribosomal protein, mitochondrial n=1 Tax=Physocladia obscura TaxID=109957 RepID=A0AAD5SWD6_9FUNG|nr:37S ribosomal protein, mitochondrial [Physocladia obscura]
MATRPQLSLLPRQLQMTMLTGRARLQRLMPPQSRSGLQAEATGSSGSTEASEQQSRDSVAHSTLQMLSVRGLLAAGAHLGHAASEQHVRMTGHVFGTRGGISIINLDHTLAALRRAAGVARGVAAGGGTVLFVATRPALHRLAVDAALACPAPRGAFVTKWIGGSLTNRARVLRRSLAIPHSPHIVVSAPDSAARDSPPRSRDPGQAPPASTAVRDALPALIVILDLKNNLHAVREAHALAIPVIAICDSDCDPALVQYPIPANDDSISSVGLIASLIAAAVREASVF